MVKWTAAIVLAFGLGAAVVYAWFASGPADANVAEWLAIGPRDEGVATTPAASDSLQHATLAEIVALPSDFEQTAALYALLRKADAATLERLLEEAEGLRPRSERLAAKSIIYARYAELDAPAAVARILAPGFAEQTLLHGVFVAWAKHDLEATLAHAETLPKDERQAAGRALLAASDDLPRGQREAIAAAFSLQDALLRMDAMELLDDKPALAWQQAVGIADGRSRLLYDIAAAWVEREPEQALAAVAALPDDQRRYYQSFMIQRWAANDVEQALAWVMAQPETTARTGLLDALARGIAETDPRQALALADTLYDAERKAVIEAALLAWARTDARAATDALQNIEDLQLSEGTRMSIVSAWSETDPHSAFEWATEQAPSLMNAHWVLTPLLRISEDDPEEALSLAGALDGVIAQAVSATIARKWAERDPHEVVAWLESASDDMPQVVATVARTLAQDSPAEALDWISTLPEASQRQALPSAIARVVRSSSDEAVDLVSAIRDPELRGLGFRALVSSWAETAPQEAAKWIARNAERQERPGLYQQLFETWAFFDVQAAADGLPDLRRQNERDSAALGVVRATAFLDFDVAEEVHADIRDEDTKRAAAVVLYTGLRQFDLERAERFRKEAGIEESETVPVPFMF